MLDGEFELDGSLLIRSGTGESGAPDMVHLQSYRNGKPTPILSGTSVAGAMRGRALRIANTVLGRDLGEELVNRMFGKRIRSHDDEPSGSRVLVKEQEIPVDKSIGDLVQSRVKIDRFTGGAYPQALFSEQPIWGKKGEMAIEINVTLRQSHDSKAEELFKAQAGLLLLVLKDLWTGDLPLGGESSVGRGRLRGKQATITYGGERWTIEERGDGKLDIVGKEAMDVFVNTFKTWKGLPSTGGEDG
jgi:CRISPR/Cas system CSM-associated protein Csm3 (group 7 of RAMP superfamily)